MFPDDPLLSLIRVPTEKAGLYIAGFYDDGTLSDAEVSCQLPKLELMKAQAITNSEECRHFLIRRYFQRRFVSEVTGGHLSFDRLQMEQKLDKRPVCLDFPDLNLTFSSSAKMYVAAASNEHPLGIDIEQRRPVVNALEIAERFFSANEVSQLKNVGELSRNEHFLMIWTAKEAGLKALGKGIVDGMNNFVVSINAEEQDCSITRATAENESWSLKYYHDFTNHLVALVQPTCGQTD